MSIINKTSYMRTFLEFNVECLEVFPSFFDEESTVKNWTAQDYAGWTDSLYEAQINNQVIEYMQDRSWRYHFNGCIGSGLSLNDAIKDHKVKYDKHLS